MSEVGQAGNGDADYISALNKLIDRAITYMGEDRALAIAESTPVQIDNDGTIDAYQGSDTKESQRATAQFVLRAYIEVVGQQLVVNMLDSSVSGELRQEMKELCRTQVSQPTSGGAVA